MKVGDKIMCHNEQCATMCEVELITRNNKDCLGYNCPMCGETAIFKCNNENSK